MTPPEVFGVVVRTIGLLGFLKGLSSVIEGGLGALHLTRLWEGFSPKDYFCTGLTYLVSGGLLIAAADTVVKAVYR